MDRTPTEQRILDALQQGPGTAHNLAEPTGRSRPATDRAVTALAKANLVVKVPDDDQADTAPGRWQLPPAASISSDRGPETPHDNAHTRDSARPAQPDNDTHPQAARNSPPIGQPTPAGDAHVDDRSDAGHEEQTSDGQRTVGAEEVKTCRGCQAQMPKVCQSCWQKTPAYCGACRRTMPQARRGEPGEPQILSNGLPKLRPGELEALVLKVMRDNPLPQHVGVVGWTGSRVAVYLPGRSTGAINNVLVKLTKAGTAELIGDNPARYRLTAEQPHPEETDTADMRTETGDGPAGSPGH